jgi:hypothetical protein
MSLLVATTNFTTEALIVGGAIGGLICIRAGVREARRTNESDTPYIRVMVTVVILIVCSAFFRDLPSRYGRNSQRQQEWSRLSRDERWQYRAMFAGMTAAFGTR